MERASTTETDGAALLVSGIRAGVREAEDELVRRYSRGMFVVINHIVRNPADAEELVHEMFMTALRKIRRGELNEPESLPGFMRSIAKNLALRHAQKAERWTPANIDEVPPPPDPDRGPLEQLLLKEEAEIVRQVLREMEHDRDRQVITRFYILEEDKESICADLGLTRLYFNGVKFRALKRFRELYEARRAGRKQKDRTHGPKRPGGGG